MLGVVGLFFPTHWYEVLPRGAHAPPRPFDGTTLLRATFFLEAIVSAILGFTGWRPQFRSADAPGPRREFANDLSERTAFILVVVVTAIAAALRFYKIGADLWLDEIATVEAYAGRPLLEIFGSYLSPGNHLLNSLLVRISYSLFGISEWSVRLPAVLFGIATIPAMYYAARFAMSRAASVAAALMLAVSYHHIFYSQDSKGYASYLFFVVLGSALLVSLLERERAGKWVAYVMTMTLSFVALMAAAFAMAAHVIVAAVALYLLRSRGIAVRPLFERLVLAFAAIGFLAFQIYALSIPDVMAIYPTIYNVQGSGYAFFSGEFIREMARGITGGFGSPLLLLPLLAVGAAGFAVFVKRNWALALSLALTVFVTIAYLLLRGQSVAPRLLLPAVPVAFLSCMATIDAILRVPRLALGAGAIVAAASMALLPSYYTAPKQPYREAIAFLESSVPEGNVVVPYPAASGFQYYVSRESLRDSARYRFAQTGVAYDSAAADPRAQTMATTLFRVTRSAEPGVAERIEREWQPVRSFRGTLGDGNVVIWKRRPIAQRQ